MKSEKDVKAGVKKTFGNPVDYLWWYMPAANGFGTPGIPDFVGCCAGHMFAIETKFGKGTRTAWQEKQANAMGLAGAKYWLVNEKNLDDWALEFHVWVSTVLALEGGR